MQWFDVDRGGLRKLLELRGKSFALLELIQNAWDADGVTRVDITLQPCDGVPKAVLKVVDDSPVGFQNLSHAWTLFAESNRKGDPEKRGRFNLGEKLVLAICEEATISSTTGSVVFDSEGRAATRAKRLKGSAFEATILITRSELSEAIATIRRLIPPQGVETFLNGERIARDQAMVASVEAKLWTEFANDQGQLRQTTRNTKVEIWPAEGGAASIFEMGIPVVETGDLYDVNIMQKVPLNMNRDNVTPAFLQHVRTVVLNAVAERLSPEDVTSPWVRNALEDEAVVPEAVTAVIDKQYGPMRVVQDPSDPEGTKIAITKGYTVIPSGAFSKPAWANIRSAEAALPAGRVTPSPKPFGLDGSPLRMYEVGSRPPAQAERIEWVRQRAHKVAAETIGRGIQVKLADDGSWNCDACYGRSNGELTINIASLDLLSVKLEDSLNELLIHEFAHDAAPDHLSNKFQLECCRMGALLAKAYREGRLS